MSEKILIRNARIMDPATETDRAGTVLVENGRIRKILPPGTAEEESAADLRTEECHPGAAGGEERPDGSPAIIDADGLVLAPGFMDVHVHFRDPGLTYKEDIGTGSDAAAAGGYTTVVCMANTKPPVDSPEVLTELRNREKRLRIRVLQASTVTKGMAGKELADLDALYAAGAAAFTDDGKPIVSEDLLSSALEKAAQYDVPISLHEEDPRFIASPGVNQGRVSGMLGLGGASARAETELVKRDIRLNRDIGAKLDIQHISAAGTVELLRQAKADGIQVWGEVTPQHLAATEDLVLRRGSLARVNPPLRTEVDRQALLQGLADGTIDCIATDHAPHAAEEKAKPIAEAPSGMIGLETALGLVMTHVVRPGYADLMTVLRALTVNPARLYGLYDHGIGRITEGGPADLVLFDPEEEWTVPDHFYSKASNSPFIGDRLTGRVQYTIAGGHIVYRKK